MKQNKKKAPPKPRLPRPKVPESERRRSSRLQGGTAEPERLTYDEWSDDERPRQRSRGSGGASILARSAPIAVVRPSEMPPGKSRSSAQQ